jgi:CelD/BcsL family acetyltransferase involved in cellulose biosynthesis
MHVELTDDPGAFAGRDWTALVSADPAGTFFHTPAYLKLWWEEFGVGSLMLAFATEDGSDLGACAFEVVDGVLRFLGGFDVTDYMGPVSLPGLEEAVAKEVLGALVADVAWDGADLRGLPEGSRWLGAVEAAASAHGLSVIRGSDGVAPLIELPGRFEYYLEALPGKLRHEIRRKERRLLAEAGAYRVRLATTGTIDADMDRFVELHRGSPGPKGRFMGAGMEIFFRRLGEEFLSHDVLQLALMEIDGMTVAGAIGFGYRDTFSLYNSTYDREFGRLSPGMVLVSALIERAIEAGRVRFDMLKGDLSYKYRFGATPRAMGRLVVSRGRPRSLRG